MRNPIARWITSLGVSAATFSCLYAWKALGIEQAGNIFLFWMWFVAAMGCFLLLTPRKYTPKTTLPKIPLLDAFSLVEHIILIALLVWFGHFVLATFSVIGLFGRAANDSHYDRNGKLKEPSHA